MKMKMRMEMVTAFQERQLKSLTDVILLGDGGDETLVQRHGTERFESAVHVRLLDAPGAFEAVQFEQVRLRPCVHFLQLPRQAVQVRRDVDVVGQLRLDRLGRCERVAGRRRERRGRHAAQHVWRVKEVREIGFPEE